jgi:hypothetical protein
MNIVCYILNSVIMLQASHEIDRKPLTHPTDLEEYFLFWE